MRGQKFTCSTILHKKNMKKVDELNEKIDHLKSMIESYSDKTKTADAVALRYGNHSTTFIDDSDEFDFSDIANLLIEKVNKKIAMLEAGREAAEKEDAERKFLTDEIVSQLENFYKEKEYENARLFLARKISEGFVEFTDELGSIDQVITRAAIKEEAFKMGRRP